MKIVMESGFECVSILEKTANRKLVQQNVHHFFACCSDFLFVCSFQCNRAFKIMIIYRQFAVLQSISVQEWWQSPAITLWDNYFSHGSSNEWRKNNDFLIHNKILQLCHCAPVLTVSTNCQLQQYIILIRTVNFKQRRFHLLMVYLRQNFLTLNAAPFKHLPTLTIAWIRKALSLDHLNTIQAVLVLKNLPTA